MSDELLDSLEAPQVFFLQDEGFLSLHAMSGKPQ
jgi:hypothetical protein